jgi:hypothetical protein
MRNTGPVPVLRIGKQSKAARKDGRAARARPWWQGTNDARHQDASMPAPVLATKLFAPPRRARLVARPRLLKPQNAAGIVADPVRCHELRVMAESRPVTLVCGHALEAEQRFRLVACSFGRQ